jgi:hypothetical protein
LLSASAIAAIVCIAELLWLRSAEFAVTRPIAALLFLPWLAAAVINLSLWYWTLERGQPTFLTKLGYGVFWTTSGGFAVGFMVLYGLLLFGN